MGMTPLACWSISQPSPCQPPGISQSRLKTDVVTKLNKGSYNMEEKLHSVALKINNDELESADHHSSSDLSIRENRAQTVKKTFQSNFSNNEESFHGRVYKKKLWIDAETASCSLKYETKMKIEAENRNHQTEDFLSGDQL